ncbi:unnamed protein product [Gemmata massiliana]|uniref:Uncharacterized protein n=2 Tax=Gemmata massiliana TaxID=1210884 RepID=A0A6P2CV54_9BACT|nr:unnamed protein product [Gemmata massiliana]
MPSRFIWSRDRKWLFCQDKACTLYATDTGKSLEINPPDLLREYGTEFGFDGRLFITSAKNGTIRVYDLPSGKLRCEIANMSADQFTAACTSDGKELVVWARRTEGWSLELIDLAKKVRRTIFDKQLATGRVIFAPYGEYIRAGGAIK